MLPEPTPHSGPRHHGAAPGRSGRLAGRRIDFCAPPFAGHLYPLIPLARRAVQEGAAVRFITGDAKLPLLRSLGFHAEAILTVRPGAMEAIANTGRPVRNNLVLMLEQLKAHAGLMLEAKPELRELFMADRPHLVVADAAIFLPGIVCQELAIPWMTCLTSPLALECRSGTPPMLGGWRESTSHLGKLRDWLGWRMVRLSKSALFWLCARQAHALGLTHAYRADGSEAIYSASSIVGLGMTEFEFTRAWPRAFRMIGPVPDTPEASLVTPMSWPAGRPRVLVTFGTHLPWLKQSLIATLQPVLRALPEHFFAISQGEPARFSRDALATGSNWSLYPYIPYSGELNHFDVVIHHGGAGIVYACIRARKPSLAIPQDYDQFDLARRVEARGLGLAVKSLSSPATVPALRALSQPERWRGPLEDMARAMERYRPGEAFIEETLRLLAGV